MSAKLRKSGQKRKVPKSARGIKEIQTNYVITPTVEREKMFAYWYSIGRNNQGTATAFKVTRNTVQDYVKKDSWNERADKMDKIIQAATEKIIVKRGISSVQTAEKLLDKELEAYNQNRAAGRLSDIMELMRYIDSVKGNLPDNGGGVNDSDTGTIGPDEIRRSANILAALALSGTQPNE